MAINNVLNNANSLQLVGTAVASSSAALTFTNLSANFYAYRLVFDSLLAATPSGFQLQLSTNNGSTWAVNFQWQSLFYNQTIPGWGQAQGGSDNPMQLSGGANTPSIILGGEILLVNPMNASTKTYGHANLGYIYNYTGFDYVDNLVADFSDNTAEATNAVRVSFQTGNITSGTVKLYGMRA